jgi:hypothetical protein
MRHCCYCGAELGVGPDCGVLACSEKCESELLKRSFRPPKGTSWRYALLFEHGDELYYDAYDRMEVNSNEWREVERLHDLACACLQADELDRCEGLLGEIEGLLIARSGAVGAMDSALT